MQRRGKQGIEIEWLKPTFFLSREMVPRPLLPSCMRSGEASKFRGLVSIIVQWRIQDSLKGPHDMSWKAIVTCIIMH